MTIHFVRKSSVLAILLACSLAAQAEIKLDEAIPVGPQVKVGKLPNGLTYYIHKNSRPEKKLEMRLVVKAGSVLEDEDQQGLAHFTEHMAFNGSTNFKKHELVSYLQSIGVKFGADLNAYTSFDETVYILPIPTTDKTNLDKGLLVLRDWAQGLTLDQADVDQERGIVLEELRLGKGASDRMMKVLWPKIFNGSKYAQRLPIGQEAVLKNFKVEAIRRFYQDWYRPDLMAVVLVGDVDPAEAEQMIKAHFGTLANPATPRAREYTRIPVPADTEAVVITDKEADSNALMIRYPLSAAVAETTFGGYREKLVEALFGGMINQRLHELTQLPKPPFVVAGSGVNMLTARYKSYTSFAVPGQGGAGPAIDALVQENARASRFGFSEAELERIKKTMMRSYEQSYLERDKTDSSTYVNEYVRNFLEQKSIPGIENKYQYVRELFPGITLDEINRYARATIPADSPRLVVYMGTSKADTPAPSGPQLLAQVAASEKMELRARDEKAVAGELMATPPKAGSIVAESEDKRLGTTTLRLSNGVQVILKPTDFRNDQVLLSAHRFGGQTLFDAKDSFAVRYAASVIGAMGVGGHSPLDLQKILTGKTASAHLELSDYSEGASGSASSGDIETMLQLLHLRFTSPRRDEGLFESYIGKQVEAARNGLARPEAVFYETIVSTMYDNNPRVARTPRPEDFSKVGLDRSLEIYRTRFSSAKGLTFIMAGSFDVAKVKPLIATYIASLPAADIDVAVRDVGIRPVAGVVKKEVRSGSEAKSNIAINFTGNAAWSQQEQMRFYAMIEVMNIRLTEILREKLALVYSASMNGSFNKDPYGNYLISAWLPTGPGTVDKAIAAAFDEIARLKEHGPDQADLNKVKQNWLEGHRKSMRENSYWVRNLQDALRHGTDPAAILDYESRVAAIMPQQIKDAARRYFDDKNYVQVVLYPEQ